MEEDKDESLEARSSQSENLRSSQVTESDKTVEVENSESEEETKGETIEEEAKVPTQNLVKEKQEEPLTKAKNVIVVTVKKPHEVFEEKNGSIMEELNKDKLVEVVVITHAFRYQAFCKYAEEKYPNMKVFKADKDKMEMVLYITKALRNPVSRLILFTDQTNKVFQLGDLQSIAKRRVIFCFDYGDLATLKHEELYSKFLFEKGFDNFCVTCVNLNIPLTDKNTLLYDTKKYGEFTYKFFKSLSHDYFYSSKARMRMFNEICEKLMQNRTTFSKKKKPELLKLVRQIKNFCEGQFSSEERASPDTFKETVPDKDLFVAYVIKDLFDVGVIKSYLFKNPHLPVETYSVSNIEKMMKIEVAKEVEEATNSCEVDYELMMA